MFMKTIDPILFTVLSDLLVNLSAGWFGVALILPIAVRKPKVRLSALTINITLGIVSLLLAFVLRKLVSV